MTPQEIQAIKDIRVGLDAGLLNTTEAHKRLVEAVAGLADAPNPILLLSSWGHPLQDTSILTQQADIDYANQIKIIGYANLPGPLVSIADKFNEQLDAGGTGASVGATLSAETEQFSLPAQFQQFVAGLGPQTEVQRRAIGQQRIPLQTAFELQRLADVAGGVESPTFLSFLQGQPNAQDVTAGALHVLGQAFGATSPTGAEQIAMEDAIAAGPELVQDLFAQGAPAQLRPAAGRVASRNILGQQAQNIVSALQGGQEGTQSIFQRFLGTRELPSTRFSNLLPSLTSAFVPGAEGGFTGPQELAQERLDEPGIGVPLIRQLLGAQFAPGLGAALNRVIDRRISGLQAQRPGANVFGQFVAGEGLGF